MIDELSQLRQRLDKLDHQLLALVAERQQTVAEIGRIKHAAGRHLRDFERERQVLERAARQGAKLGLGENLCHALMGLLIEESLGHQEQGGLTRQSKGHGLSALIIGGQGRMGRWFADYLSIQGYQITVADPAGGECAYPLIADWRVHSLDSDLIVVATPMGASLRILRQLAQAQPAGVVFDVGSLKTPLMPGLDALRQNQVKVCSLHPLFGPSVSMLSGRHVAIVDVGCPAANEVAARLFSGTMAELITMSAAEHDRLMAYVLSFSHLLNIVFTQVLVRSGEEALNLRTISSTTFEGQLRVARRIAEENPQVYYEIQAENPYAKAIREQCAAILAELSEIINQRDQLTFRQRLEENRRYLSATAQAPRPGRDGQSETAFQTAKSDS